MQRRHGAVFTYARTLYLWCVLQLQARHGGNLEVYKKESQHSFKATMPSMLPELAPGVPLLSATVKGLPSSSLVVTAFPGASLRVKPLGVSHQHEGAAQPQRRLLLRRHHAALRDCRCGTAVLVPTAGGRCGGAVLIRRCCAHPSGSL